MPMTSQLPMGGGVVSGWVYPPPGEVGPGQDGVFRPGANFPGGGYILEVESQSLFNPVPMVPVGDILTARPPHRRRRHSTAPRLTVGRDHGLSQDGGNPLFPEAGAGRNPNPP